MKFSCEKIFVDKGTHLSFHKEKSFKCKEDCDISILENYSLVKHEFINQENRSDRLLKCSTCEKKV